MQTMADVQKKRKTKVICSSSLCGWLLFNGFYLVDVRRDLKNNRKRVYIFNDTEKLAECMSDYGDNKLKRKFY
jgi:hypothetical protein